MDWLNRLLGRDTAKAGRSRASYAEVASDGPPSQAIHLALLAKFLRGNDPVHVGHPGWDAVLGEPTSQVIQRFQRAGWLVDAPLNAKLGNAFKVPKLKEELKARGLKVSGKKDELIARLIDADHTGMEALAAGVSSLVCSPSAAVAATAYVDDREARQQAAHHAALDALSRGDVRTAVQSIVAFERTEVMPRGLGIDWHSAGMGQHLETQARDILRISPRFLALVPDEEVLYFRAAAAMMFLTGQNRAKGWLPEGVRGHPALDLDTTARMYLFAASNKRSLTQMRESGVVKQVRVSNMGEFSCPACRAFGDKTYNLGEPPELPHHGCSHELGCRCSYEAVMDFD